MVLGIVPGAEGAAQGPRIVDERPAAQHPRGSFESYTDPSPILESRESLRCCMYTNSLSYVQTDGGPTKGTRATPKARAGQDTSREVPRRKNYRLHQSKLDAARKVLGTETETETIERALDLVAFGERLAEGTRRARGRLWNDVFGELEGDGAAAEA